MTPFKICTYLWAVLAIFYLVLSLLNKKETALKEKTLSRLIYLSCLGVGMAFIFYENFPYGHLADPIFGNSNPTAWTGTTITAIGLGFSLWARVIIGSNWSGVVMVKKDHKLIQTGPFAIIRHPTYSGFIFALLGTVIALNEWRGIAGFVILVISFLWKTGKEEKILSSHFPNYPEYQQRTKKIIPFIY